MKNYESLSHTRYDCKYHVVFIPKYRRKKIYGAIRRHLGEIFHELAKGLILDFRVPRLRQIGEHILVQVRPRPPWCPSFPRTWIQVFARERRGVLPIMPNRIEGVQVEMATLRSRGGRNSPERRPHATDPADARGRRANHPSHSAGRELRCRGRSWRRRAPHNKSRVAQGEADGEGELYSFSTRIRAAQAELGVEYLDAIRRSVLETSTVTREHIRLLPDGTELKEIWRETRPGDIRGAMWWLERRFEGFQRNFKATGQVLGERFEIAIVDPIEPADPAEDEPSDDPAVG